MSQEQVHNMWTLHGPRQSTQWSTLMPSGVPHRGPTLDRGIGRLIELPAAVAPLLAGHSGQGAIANQTRDRPVTELEYALQRLSCSNRAGPLNQPAVLFGLATQQRLRLLADSGGHGHEASHVPGTSAYQAALRHDLDAMTVWHGPPLLFLTVSCPAQDETWLGTRVSHWAQTNNIPWQVWHAADERALLAVRPLKQPPALSDVSWVHRRSAFEDDTCPYHTFCQRIPLQALAADFLDRDLDPSALHDLCRIYEQNLVFLLRNVLRTTASRLKLTAWLKIVEFTRQPHSHTVCWSEHLVSEQLRHILERLQLGRQTWQLSDEQLQLVADLAGRLITCTRSADRLKSQFPELTQGEAAEVCQLVDKYQIHTCGPSCVARRDENGNLPDQPCKHWAPWLPASIRVCPRQPQENDRHAFARLERIEASLLRVQASLRETDFPVGPEENDHAALAQFLRQLFGDPLFVEPNDWLWAGVKIPQDLPFGRLRGLLSSLPGIPPGPAGQPDILVLTCYHTFLQLRRQPRVYHKRSLSDCFVSPYNPLALAAWQGNLQVELVTHTRGALFAYATKGTSASGVDELLRELDRRGGPRDGPAAEHIRSMTGERGNLREVPMSEALYSVDRRLSHSSVFPSAVLSVNANLRDGQPQFTRLKQLYAARGGDLESVCFAQFASWYRPAEDNEDPPDHRRAAVPAVYSSWHTLGRPIPPIGPAGSLREGNFLQVRSECHGAGVVSRRRVPAVVREGSTEYGKLVLYMPWRDEDIELRAYRDEGEAIAKINAPPPPDALPGPEPNIPLVLSYRERCIRLFREAILYGET